MSKKSKFNKTKLLKFTVFFLLSFYASWTLITQEIEISQTKKQLNTISSNIDKQTKIKEDLKKKKKLVNTPKNIEKIARDELNYAAPDEIVFMDATQGF